MKIKLFWIAACVAVAAVIYAVMPLFGRSYIPTHDGEYHIIRIVEFSRMLGAGYLFPRWAPDMNSGYGIPIFNYQYPLPNYIGSLIRVFTRDAVYAFQVSMGLGYIAVAAAAFLWLSSLFGVFPALVGAVVASYVPYLFVDTYVRGSIGEVWATALLLFGLFLLEKKKYVWFALSYGLLILSHNIMAMLFTPFILGYTVIRSRAGIKWMLGGLGLSAFFWIPALLESKYVVGLNTVNFRDYFVQTFELLVPSWGTGFSGTEVFGNTMSVQIGLAPLLSGIAGIWVILGVPRNRYRPLGIYLVAVAVVCVFFMQRISMPLWEIIKPLQYMQYPWRLLSFVIPVAGFAAAWWVSVIHHKWWGLALVLFAIIVAGSYARPVLYAPRNEAYYMSRPNFTDGTSSMGNSFSTVWTGWKDVRAASYVSVENGLLQETLKSAYLDHEFRISLSSASAVSVHTLYFPGWKASVDNVVTPISFEADGIVRVNVPAGTHTLRVWFTDTPVRLIADYVSAASLVILILSAILAL